MTWGVFEAQSREDYSALVGIRCGSGRGKKEEERGRNLDREVFHKSTGAQPGKQGSGRELLVIIILIFSSGTAIRKTTARLS